MNPAPSTFPAPIVVDGFVLHSIFDDSDPFYHSDALTGQTPAKARHVEVQDEKTKA